MESREALVALNLIEHIGPVRVRQLMEHFGEAPAILLSYLAGFDPQDAGGTAGIARPPGQTEPFDYTSALHADGLRGARLGVARKYFHPRPQSVKKLEEQTLDALKQAGAILIDPIEIPALSANAHEILLYEFKAGLNAYLASLGPNPPVRSLKDIIEFNERHRDQELLWFGQETFIQAQAEGPLTEPAYLDALAAARRSARQDGLDAVMDKHQLDAIVAPTTGPAHITDPLYGDRDTGGSSTPAAVAGYPSITLPAGFVSGLPVGISFFGRAWSEPLLLKLACAFEQHTKHRLPPRFHPSMI